MAEGDIKPGEPPPPEASYFPSNPSAPLLIKSFSTTLNPTFKMIVTKTQPQPVSPSNERTNPPNIQSNITPKLSYSAVVSRDMHSSLGEEKKPIDFHNQQKSVPDSMDFRPTSTYQGKPAVTFTISEKQALVDKLKFVLVGKFSHGRPSFVKIREFFAALKLNRTCKISAFDKKHIFIECACKNDYDRIMLKLVWSIEQFPMRILKWSADFNPLKESPIVPVWIRIEGLPLYFFDEASLLSIANSIGKPIRVDPRNVAHTIVSSARVCVELDVSQPLLEDLWVSFADDKTKFVLEGFWAKVYYDVVPFYCGFCSHLGHKENRCMRVEEHERARQAEKKNGNMTAIDDQHGIVKTAGRLLSLSTIGTVVEQDPRLVQSAAQGAQALYNVVDLEDITLDESKYDQLETGTAVSAGTSKEGRGFAKDCIVNPEVQFLQSSLKADVLSKDRTFAAGGFVSEANGQTADTVLVEELTMEEGEISESIEEGDIVAAATPQKSATKEKCPCVKPAQDSAGNVAQGDGSYRARLQLAAAGDGVGTGQILQQLEQSKKNTRTDFSSLKCGSNEKGKGSKEKPKMAGHTSGQPVSGGLLLGELLAATVQEVQVLTVQKASSPEQSTAGKDKLSATVSAAVLVEDEDHAAVTASPHSGGIMLEQVERVKGMRQLDGMLVKSMIQGANSNSHKTSDSCDVLVEKDLLNVSQSWADLVEEEHAQQLPPTGAIKSESEGADGSESECKQTGTQQGDGTISEERQQNMMDYSTIEGFAMEEIEMLMASPTRMDPVFTISVPNLNNEAILDLEGTPVLCSEVIRKSSRIADVRKHFQFLSNEKLVAAMVEEGKYEDFIMDAMKAYTKEIHMAFLEQEKSINPKDSATDKVTSMTQEAIPKVSTMDEKEWTTPKRRGRNRNRPK